MCDSDDEPPPLEEDVGEEEKNVDKIEDEKKDDETALLEQMMSAAKVAERKKEKLRRKKVDASTKTFGSGFKKGFFNRKAKKKKSSRKSNSSIPTLKPKSKATENLVIPEVQTEMNRSALKTLEKGAWANEKLVEKIKKNPSLAQKFMDPRFAHFAKRFQDNPKGVMKEAQSNPELREFLSSLMSVLGEHFTEMGAAATSSTGTAKEAPRPSRAAQEAAKDPEVRRVLNDPDLRSLLTDPKMKTVLQECQTKPGALQYYMRIPEVRKKLQRMASAGLIKIQ